MTSRPVRVAVISSAPIQYMAPLFRALAREPSIDLTVLYSSSVGTNDSKESYSNFGQRVVWDVDLLSGYRSKVLFNPGPAHPFKRRSMLSLGLIGELRAHRYDVVVVFGWAYPKDWLSFILSAVRHIPFLLFSDADIRDASISGLGRVRDVVLSLLCRRAAGALHTGTFNRDFYIRHGMAPERLWFAPFAVETDRFALPERNASRRSLGLDEECCYFAFVGALIPRKRPLEMVRAISMLQKRGAHAGLIIAGSGALEGRVRDLVQDLNLANTHLLGFVNQRDLPTVYRAADVFMLLSERDPRALVVNEAMAAGLPVLLSRHTSHWGPGDLVRDGREGLVVDIGDDDAIMRALERMMDTGTRTAMAQASWERVRLWTYERSVTGWLEAASAVITGSARA